MTDRAPADPPERAVTVASRLSVGRLTVEFERRTDIEKEYRQFFGPEWRRINLAGIAVLAGFMLLVQASDLFRHAWSNDLAVMVGVRTMVVGTALWVGVLVWRNRGCRDGDWAVFAFLIVYLWPVSCSIRGTGRSRRARKTR